MDDAFLVSRLQPLGNLLEERKGFTERDGASHDPLGQGLARHELHHQKVRPVRLFEPVNRGDVGMIQRSKEPGFALEASQALFVLCESFQDDFDGDISS